MYDNIAQLCITLGIENFDFHSLRHTHCTMLIEQGANPKYVQVRMGHKNIEMTLGIYNHVIERMKNDGYDIINKIF